MERLVEWECKEKGVALPVSIDEDGNVVPLEDICAQLATIYDILGDDYDLDRLREMVEADRDGRLKVSPVKPGSVVYFIASDEGRDFVMFDIVTEVNMFLGDSIADGMRLDPNSYFRTVAICANIAFEEIGKSIFLSKEEAERALRKEGDHEKCVCDEAAGCEAVPEE